MDRTTRMKHNNYNWVLSTTEFNLSIYLGRLYRANGHGIIGMVIIIIILYRSRLCFRLQLPTELRSGRHPAADRSQNEQDNQHVRASHILHLFCYLLFYDISSSKHYSLPHIHLSIADWAKNVYSFLLFEMHVISLGTMCPIRAA